MSTRPAPRFARTLPLCAIVLLTTGFTHAFAAGKCTLGKLAEIPITMTGPRALATVKINGQESQLTVDSGAFYSMISPSSSVTLGLKPSPLPYGFQVRGFAGGRADVMHVSVKTLTFAGADLHNIGFLVGGTDIGSGSVGLLGRNILYFGDVEYDFAHGFVRMFEAKDCSQTPLAYWTGASSQAPIYVRDDFHQSSTGTLIPQAKAPWMYTNLSPVWVNGVEYHAEIDTGSPVSFLSVGAAAKVGITPESPGVVFAGDSFGVGKTTFRTYIARFDSFKIGQEEIRNAKLRVGDIDLPGIDMILGADFVLSHRIYVANSQHKMYFTYNGGPVFDLAVKPKKPAGPAEPAQASASGDAAGDAAPASTAAAQGTEDPADLARRGEALESRSDFEQALHALNRACELAPDNAEYVYRRGRVRVELQQLPAALADYDRSLQLRPNELAVLLARAELKIRMQDKAGARTDLDAADAVAPRQHAERFRMATDYEYAGQFDRAIGQLTLWIDAHDQDARLPNALNERCWIRGLGGTDLPQALKDCTQALRLADKSGVLYPRIADSRGLVFLRMGAFDKSIADYDTALKLNPKDAWSWYGRGIDRLRKGRQQDGNADIQHAVALWPEVAAEFQRRGIIADAANP
jgi:tetratricopeptide (TPR) repeat protein